MSITIQEACRRFIDDLNEKVPHTDLERYMKALSGFLEYLHGIGVVELDRLSLQHIDEYVSVGFAIERADARDVRDLWTAMERFVKWLDRWKLRRMQKEFAACRRELREQLDARFEQTR